MLYDVGCMQLLGWTGLPLELKVQQYGSILRTTGTIIGDVTYVNVIINTCACSIGFESINL